MKIITKLKTLITKEDIEETNSEVIKNGLDVIPLYCNYFAYDEYDKNIDLLFYLDFDESKVNILDLVTFGKYYNESHILKLTFKDLVDMRLTYRSSEIVNEFFAKISDVNLLDKVVDDNLSYEEIEKVIYSIIDNYNGYESSGICFGYGDIWYPTDIDKLIYKIRKFNNDKDIDYTKYIPFTFNLKNIPHYYLNSLIGYVDNLNIEVDFNKAYEVDNDDRYPLTFEGKPYYFNEEEAIYSIINCAKSFKGNISSILPQGLSVNANFTITLDRIFTCLDACENDTFKSFLKNDILFNNFTEEEIESFKYIPKKTDEEIEFEFDKEVDEIILIEEGGEIIRDE